MDTKSLDVFFQLLQLGLETVIINENNKIDIDVLSTSVCWNDIYELSVKQGVAAFLLDGLQKATEWCTTSRCYLKGSKNKTLLSRHAGGTSMEST